MVIRGFERHGWRPRIVVTATLALVSGLIVVPGLASAASATVVTAPATGTVQVQKGGVRTASSTVAGLADATFDAYVVSSASATAPSGSVVASCTTNASGACDLKPIALKQSDGKPTTTYVLVKERTSPAGYNVISQLALGSLSGTLVTPYVTTVTLNSGNGFTAKASTTSAPLANQKVNPDVASKCGLSIAVLFDQSGSISSSEMSQMKSAAAGFVDALTGTPSQVALYTFSTSAPGTDTYASAPVLTATDAAAVKAHISGLPSAGDGYTNWDRGLWQIANASEKYNLVLVLTDGDPNRSVNDTTGTDVTRRVVEDAVFSANAVKATGAQVIGLGIGMFANSLNNLKAISGPTAGKDYFDTEFANLDSALADIAQKSCGGTVTVQKKVVEAGVTSTSNGWTFTGSHLSDGSVSPTSGQTATVSGVGDGLLTFNLSGGTWPKTLTVTEQQKSGYSLTGVTCTRNGAGMGTITPQGTSITVSVGASDAVNCIYTNTKADIPVEVTADAAPTATRPTCSVDGHLVITTVPGVTFTGGSNGAGPGSYHIVATAQPGYVLTGTTSWDITVLPATQDCPAALTDPEITAPTCSVAGSVDLPADTKAITYSLQGSVVTATTHAPFLLTATPGWTLADNRLSATYQVPDLSPTNDCPVVLVAPTVHDATCAVSGYVTTAPDTANVAYSQSSVDDVVTVTATTHAPYVFSETAGWKVAADGLSATFEVTVDAATNDCPAVLVTPTVEAPTCSTAGSVDLPASTDTVTYSVKGSVVTATTHSPYVFSDTAGWVVADGGLTATFDAGNLSPTNDCPVTPELPTITPPTCSASGSIVLPADTETVSYSLEGNVVTATTHAPFQFIGVPDGWTVSTDGLTATQTFDVAGPTNDCAAQLADPVVTQPTCTTQGSIELPESTETVSYSLEGNVVTATTQAPFVFTETSGWQIAEDGLTATFTVEFVTPEGCPTTVVVTPVAPTITAATTCGVTGTYTIPNTTGVVYLRNDVVLLPGVYHGPITDATITAQAQEGFELSDPEWSSSVTIPAANPCTIPDTGGGTDLPQTGAQAGWLVGGGAAALLVGLFLVVAGRRREDTIG
jgi:LPXTG-motif cell wall-anchored protein